MTAISYHDTVNDLQDLAWQARNPFARPEWFALLEESGIAPLIVCARQGQHAVALPLHNAPNHIEALTNWYAFTWSDLRTQDVVSAGLLQQLATDLAKRTSRVELSKLAAEDGTVGRMRRAFRSAGWSVLHHSCDINHVLPLRGRDYATYLAERPGALRSTLKRKSGLVDTHVSTCFSAEEWAAYEAIYAASWKPEEGDPVLLRRFAEHESAMGRLRMGLARKDGEPVAAQLWTADDGTAYIHKLAHRESAKSLSAGTTLTATLLQHVIDIDRVSLVDFGTGDDSYKRDWMEEARKRWSLTCLRPENPRNWPLIARHALQKLVRLTRNG